MKQKDTKPETITIQLDEETAALLKAVMVTQDTMSTPTQMARSCLTAGLIRVAVACSHSPLADFARPAKAALARIPQVRIESACLAIKP